MSDQHATKTVAEKVAERLTIDPATGCANWVGATSHGGYGSLTSGGIKYRAHRVSYEAAKGPIPQGLVIDHLCRNPPCCNPDHLEAVTMRENTLRGVSIVARCAKVTQCPQAHAYDDENTYHTRKGRRCKACAMASQRIYRAKKLAQKESLR